MPDGLDMTFLVLAEILEHPRSFRRAVPAQRLLDQKVSLVLAPQVLSEFVHVVTDPRRFERPLSVPQALSRAEHWWNSREVTQVFPTDASTRLCLRWMGDYKLGRKRLLDTQRAATYHCAGVDSIVTTNARDYLQP